MSMRDLHNNQAAVIAITPKTIINSGSPENLVSGDIDLQFFNSERQRGDHDDREVILEHADDNAGVAGTYAFVALADVLGPSSVTSGVVATTTTDQEIIEVGYIGDKRWIRVTLQPTSLTNGGPVSALVNKGHPRHAPQ